jgi:hypothetical protein
MAELDWIEKLSQQDGQLEWIKNLPHEPLVYKVTREYFTPLKYDFTPLKCKECRFHSSKYLDKCVSCRCEGFRKFKRRKSKDLIDEVARVYNEE